MKFHSLFDGNHLKNQILTQGILQENEDTFFQRIRFLFPASDYRYKEINKAYRFAEKIYENKKRRDNGEHAFEHIRAVALILIVIFKVTNYELIIAALLHDVVEDDKNYTIDTIRKIFGERVAILVDFLTKPDLSSCPGTTYEEQQECRNSMYYNRWWQAPYDAVLIKVADLLHNMWTIYETSPQKKINKIKQIFSVFMPLVRIHKIPFPELLENAYYELISEFLPAPEEPLGVKV